MVTTDPTVDIAQQMLPLFNGDAELQDPGVASFVEFAFYKNEGFGTMWEPSSFHLVSLATHHGGGSRGRAFSSRSEGQALSLDPLQAP